MSSKKYYLLDTFEGIPLEQISTAEFNIGVAHMNRKYDSGDKTYLDVKEKFKKWENCKVIRGKVPDTLDQVDSKKFSYVSIDMNVTAAEIAAAEFLWPKMVPGAIMLLDDYGWESHIQQKIAFDEFALRHGIQILSLPTGKAILMKPYVNEKEKGHTMKAVILAGGLGTRISEETHLRPKPMIEIGGKPILWHVMKIYSSHGINDFIICCGYKGYIIKEYFANYFLHMSDVTFDMKDNTIKVHEKNAEPWRVTLIDTGENTQTGGRLKRIKPYIEDQESFCFTYGDGLSDVNIGELVDFHKSHGKLATVTAVQPPGRYGALNISDKSLVTSFSEKPRGDGGSINGGFFVISPKAIDYIEGDSTPWEQKPLEKLANESQLHAYFHYGFWQPMDTLREKNMLEELWQQGSAPWKTW